MDQDQKGTLFAFFANEGKKLNEYVRRRMQNVSEMDSEDIVADVLVSLISKPDTALHIENITAYVYKSIYYRMIDFQRTSNRSLSLQTFLDDDGENTLIDLLADKTASVSNEAERREFLRRLGQAIGKLDARQKAVFIATEFEGRSYRELSLTWNEPVGTILSRKHRTVKLLRKMLKDWENE